jgi:hypothetical protein
VCKELERDPRPLAAGPEVEADLGKVLYEPLDGVLIPWLAVVLERLEIRLDLQRPPLKPELDDRLRAAP